MKSYKDEKIHFIGVGGVSMSALAKFVKTCGATVTGSDREISQSTKDLEKLFPVYYGENTNVVEKCDKVVYSSAISRDNLELSRAIELGIPTFERHQFLGEISKQFAKTVAIGGTHGKTTVSAMVAHGLKSLNANFSAHIGGETEFGNLILSGDEIFVTEACEYKRSLLSLYPHLSVLLNAELDHPDCYQNMQELLDVYLTFLEKGKIQIFPAEFLDICSNAHIPIEKYEKMWGRLKTVERTGELAKDSVMVLSNAYVKIWHYNNLRIENGVSQMDVCVNGEMKGTAYISNYDSITAYNSLVVFAILDALGYAFENIKGCLKSFIGVKRRREFVGYLGKAKVVFDYAHHPTQIRNMLSIYNGKTLVVFQPHTYSRTKAYFDDFCDALALADQVVVMPTYGAREQIIDGADSKTLANQISTIIAKERVEHIVSTDKTIDYVISNGNDYDNILFLGAGDIYALKDGLLPYLSK